MGKNFSYKENKTIPLSIKGVLSADCETVTVEEKDGDRQITLKDYLRDFADDYVEISVRNKIEDDLSE
jgi:hypothetical protein